MAQFPTLTVVPVFPIPKKPQDTDVKTTYEGGYVSGRCRYTRDLFDYELTYPLLFEADMLALEAHIAIVKSTVIFQWIHPERGTTHNVRYLERPEIVLTGSTGTRKYWSTTFTLSEA